MHRSRKSSAQVSLLLFRFRFTFFPQTLLQRSTPLDPLQSERRTWFRSPFPCYCAGRVDLSQSARLSFYYCYCVILFLCVPQLFLVVGDFALFHSPYIFPPQKPNTVSTNTTFRKQQLATANAVGQSAPTEAPIQSKANNSSNATNSPVNGTVGANALSTDPRRASSGSVLSPTTATGPDGLPALLPNCVDNSHVPHMICEFFFFFFARLFFFFNAFYIRHILLPLCHYHPLPLFSWALSCSAGKGNIMPWTMAPSNTGLLICSPTFNTPYSGSPHLPLSVLKPTAKLPSFTCQTIGCIPRKKKREGRGDHSNAVITATRLGPKRGLPFLVLLTIPLRGLPN